MILGEVEETVTVIEIDEETYEEVITIQCTVQGTPRCDFWKRSHIDDSEKKIEFQSNQNPRHKLTTCGPVND